MPSLNFSVFIDKVAAGTKPHSIRAGERFKAGDELSFFTGMRTKGCRRLRANTPCTAAVPISIFTNERIVIGEGSAYYYKGALQPHHVEQLAKRDGFASVSDFWDFFRAQIRPGFREFRGQLIEWDPEVQDRLGTMKVGTVGGSYCNFAQGERVKVRITRDGSRHQTGFVERVKWRGSKVALCNQCSGVPLSYIELDPL